MVARVGTLFHNTFVRYLVAIATVASTFSIRLWLIPFTGTGAPFVLFFTAVLVTSLAAGIGPGICAVVLSVPLAAYTFVTRAGYPPLQAAVQGLLFAVDGMVVVYLAFLMKRDRQAVQGANQRLRWANEEIIRSMVRTREVIELAPDAFFQADLDGRFTDVNQAACRLLGYERDELLGKTIFDIIPAEDADRLMAVGRSSSAGRRVNTAEWTQKRRDGTFVPVEVSSNIHRTAVGGRSCATAVFERKRVDRRCMNRRNDSDSRSMKHPSVWHWSRSMGVSFVSIVLCEIVGYTSAELTGLTFQAITILILTRTSRLGQLARGNPTSTQRKRYIERTGRPLIFC
jgi:PAS domain S-box-containing protein